MKQTVEFYYNLSLDDIEEANGNYHFIIDNQDYFFVFLSRREEEVYDIFDIVNFSNKLLLTATSTKLYRNNWALLWSKKIDYFEYQIKELAFDKSIIQESVAYYIGLTELAISYVNATNKKFGESKMGKIVLSHRRVGYPNYKLNFLNPLSFIFDLEVRDVAEYLKVMLFYMDIDEVIEELETYLKIQHLDLYEYQMLLARLIYPTYYFDTYEKVIDKDENAEKLVAIIKKVDDIEYFLKKAYEMIASYAQIEKIDWFID